MASVVDSFEAGSVWGQLVKEYSCPGVLPTVQGRLQDATGAEWQANSRSKPLSELALFAVIAAAVKGIIGLAYSCLPSCTLQGLCDIYTPSCHHLLPTPASIRLLCLHFADRKHIYTDIIMVHVLLSKLHGITSSALVLNDWSSSHAWHAS